MSALDGKMDDQRAAALRIMVVAEAPEQRVEIAQTLKRIEDPVLEVVEAASGPQREEEATAADVTIVVCNRNEEATLRYLRREAERTVRPALFVLAEECSPILMRRILTAGADELLFFPLDLADVTRALLKVNETRRRAEHNTGGLVCSVISSVGGVGVTTIAANLALALRRATGLRVLAVDLDLQAGALALALNLEPERSIREFTGSDARLEQSGLEAALASHPSGLCLLAAPGRVEDTELVSDAVVGALLELGRQSFDFVVVDCGSYIDENAVAAWERSDHLFYVLDQSIGSARGCTRFIELFGRLGLQGVEPSLVLNRFMPKHPISEEHLGNTLGRTFFARLPADERLMERAQARGQDLWQVGAGSPLVRAFEEMARRVATPEAESAVQTGDGLLARLFGGFEPRR